MLKHGVSRRRLSGLRPTNDTWMTLLTYPAVSRNCCTRQGACGFLGWLTKQSSCSYTAYQEGYSKADSRYSPSQLPVKISVHETVPSLSSCSRNGFRWIEESDWLGNDKVSFMYSAIPTTCGSLQALSFCNNVSYQLKSSYSPRATLSFSHCLQQT